MERPTIPTPKENINTSEIEGYVINALGEKVPLYKEYKGDYAEDTISNSRKSYENIAIHTNNNIQEFFKYNKEDKMGYLVYYDISTKKEVPGGTHLPLKLLYPFSIDEVHSVVSTRMQEDYPILFTEEPTPQEIRDEWNNLEFIYREREAALSDKRSEALARLEEENLKAQEDDWSNDPVQDEEEY